LGSLRLCSIAGPDVTLPTGRPQFHPANLIGTIGECHDYSSVPEGRTGDTLSAFTVTIDATLGPEQSSSDSYRVTRIDGWSSTTYISASCRHDERNEGQACLPQEP
jgi:hypothetical protein